jgi:hypothetical protein
MRHPDDLDPDNLPPGAIKVGIALQTEDGRARLTDRLGRLPASSQARIQRTLDAPRRSRRGRPHTPPPPRTPGAK